MVPRTFLSLPFPYARRGQADAAHLGGFGYLAESYWRPRTRATTYGWTGPDETYDPSTHIPPGYWERIAIVDGLWDDGEHLITITWLDVTVYPSWAIVAAWWDRSSGGHRDRQEVHFTIVPPTTVERGLRTEFTVDDPELEALGTEIDAEVPYSSGISPYVRGFSLSRDGQVWSVQEGFVNALCKVRMISQAAVWAAPRQQEVRAPGSAQGQMDAILAAYEREDAAWLQGATAGGEQAATAYAIGTSQARLAYPAFPPALPPGQQVDTDPDTPGVQAPVPENPSREQVQATIEAMDPGSTTSWFYTDDRTGQTYAIREPAPAGYLRAADQYTGTAANRATVVQVPRTLFLPGNNTDNDRILFTELGVITTTCFAMITDNRVLLALTNVSTYPQQLLPAVWWAVADVVPGRITGANSVGGGGTMLYPPTVRKVTLLPQWPIALAFDEHETRAWALLADSTVCCFDYESGEVLSYFWLPLPFAVGVGSSVKMTWQRNYRRLLVFAHLPGNDPTRTRNRYDSRIVGYSTTPLPVHVCRPIPLRPVRRGRPTPFLIKQCGSLCEPIAGLVTLQPGSGVQLDRATVALDDTAEAQVWVTPNVEGEATLGATIEVAATWDQPVVPVPFNAITYSEGRGQNVASNGPWIEGLPP